MPQQLIGRVNAKDFDLCPWPARSSDFTAGDFFLWRFVKDKVYALLTSANINDMTDRLITAVNTVHLNKLRRIRKGFLYRLNVHAAGDGRIEHL